MVEPGGFQYELAGERASDGDLTLAVVLGVELEDIVDRCALL